MIKGVNTQAVSDTPNDQIDAIFKELGESFNTDRTLSLSFRKTMLDSLRRGIEKHENDLATAMRSDLKLSTLDAYMTNTSLVVNEIKECMNHLSSWAKEEKRKTPIALYPGKSFVKP